MADHPLREVHRALGANPPSRGPDVQELQDSINKLIDGWKLHLDSGKLVEDGDFGKRTRRAANFVLELLGVDPAGEGPAGPTFTQEEQKAIRNPDSRTKEQKERSKRRVSDEQERESHQDGGVAAIRAKIVAYALWGADHEPSIHYAQIRPYPSDARHLPMSTDCSGFSTLAYKDAGAPDPNGLGFNGSGFTGTLIAHMDHVAPSSSKKGNLIVYGAAPSHHVVIAIEDGPNPMCVSHGQEGGPFRIRHSTEAAFQPSPATFCSILG